jgi:anti-anti-sigma regulatory factor
MDSNTPVELTDIADGVVSVALGATPSQVLAALRDAPPKKNLLLDCTGVDILPSVDIATIIQIHKAMLQQEQQVGLFGVGNRLFSIFQAFRLQMLFPIAATAAEAQEQFADHQ